MGGWEIKELGELIDIFDSQRIPVNSRDRSKMQGEYPYYGASGIVDHVDDYLFEGRYLLIAEDGANLLSRKTPVAFFADGRFWVNNHAHIVRGKDSVAVDKFLQAYINATDISGYVTGAAQPKLSQTNLKKIKVNIPDLSTQKKIASILSAFDELIENNSRRIEILEEMARRIYREWFVHFRYPGHEDDELVDSGTELGEIPEGWEVKQIQDIVDRSNSGLKPIDHPDEEFYYYSFSAYDEGQRPEIIKGEEIKSRKYVLSDDAVIISKLNPRIPRIWYAKPKTDLRCLASTEFLILNGADGISNAFVYSLLRSHKFYGRFRSMTGGTSTSHQRVKPKDFKKMKIALSEKGLLNKFQKKAGQLFDLAYNLREKNKKLKETRDLLLPKLISGKIEVQRELCYDFKKD